MVDLVIKNGSIAFGDLSPIKKADVVIDNGVIIDIVDSFFGDAKDIIEAQGKIVSPTFIDIHTHSDVAPLLSYNVSSKLFQGVGFELGGNCGISMLPSTEQSLETINKYFFSELAQPAMGYKISEKTMSEYKEAVDKVGAPINYGLLVGHGTLRGCIMGFNDREPTKNELEALCERLDYELKNGAYGMSLGLIYPPSAFSKMEELIALAKVVYNNNGILAVHIRNESKKVFQAVQEMIDVARVSKVHLQISHLKLIGKPQWGRAKELLELIENARKEGLTITCDQYPYPASSTTMTALLPHWAHDGGLDCMLERLQEPTEELALRIEEEIEARGGAERILVVSTSGKYPEYHGKNLLELSEMLGKYPEYAVVEILLKCKSGVTCVYFSMHEDDVNEIIKDMNIAVGSDGYSYTYDKSIMEIIPHPRSFGTFPKFIQTVRENNLLSISQTVYKMTGLPASILGLEKRGIIKIGNIADITVFDWDKTEDMCTFENSIVKPKGIENVIISGKIVLKNGTQTEERPGRALLHK